nr:TolC family protein [Sphingomonas jejuensis]
MADPAPDFFALLEQSRSSPRAAEQEATVAAAEARARQAGVRPNPSLSLEVENFAGTSPYTGLDAHETTLVVGQTLELGGKREARVAAARADVSAARARQEQVLVQYAADLAEAYATAEAAVARRALAIEAVELAEVDARTARLLVENGREAELRRVQANAELERARAGLVQAQAEEAAAFARLTAAAGSPVAFDSLAGSLLSRPLLAVTATTDAPAVSTARAERAAADARVRSEARRAIPDVTLSGGVRRFGERDATALVAGVSVSLPLFDRNRGATEAARAELRAAEARVLRAQADAEAERRAAGVERDAADARLQATLSGEQAAAEAYRLARIGYEAGRLPLLELTAARRALVEARGSTIDIRLARVRAEAEAARLSGRIPFGS